MKINWTVRLKNRTWLAAALALLDKLSTGVRYNVTITGVTEPVAQRILRDYGGQMEVMGV